MPTTPQRAPRHPDRLAGLKEAALRIAFIVGDDARDPDAPWRAPLHSALDRVFDISPQRGFLRAAAITTHVDGLLRSVGACRGAMRRPARAQTPVSAPVAAMPAAPVQ